MVRIPRKDPKITPFSIRILDHETSNNIDSSHHTSHRLPSRLPALYYERPGDLVPASHNIIACIEKKLNLDRLAQVQKWLWLAGLPLPPRAIHHQLLLGRQIFITEQMDMHLVWMTGRMFLKPLPRFLLEPDFWAEYLSCELGCRCSHEKESLPISQQECRRGILRRRALGFLFSYTALLSHESDFMIARDKHLLPREVEWPAWRMLVDQLDTQHIYPYIDPRFFHGELRLSRLNKMYALSQTPLCGYMPRWDQYGAFFHDHFTWLASGTLYIAVVLSAMQVGLATSSLQENKAFQSASYGFTVFSIFGPLITAFIILLLFFCVFIFNWTKAHNQKKARYSELQVLCNS